MTQYEEEIRILKLEELIQTRSSLIQDIELIDAQIEVLTPKVEAIKTQRTKNEKRKNPKINDTSEKVDD
jgi:hypothetical protein